jgi:hypothetical protein
MFFKQFALSVDLSTPDRLLTTVRTYDHKNLYIFFCDHILFAICTSKIINELIINQAAVHTITMGASGNAGLTHAQTQL